MEDRIKTEVGGRHEKQRLDYISDNSIYNFSLRQRVPVYQDDGRSRCGADHGGEADKLCCMACFLRGCNGDRVGRMICVTQERQVEKAGGSEMVNHGTKKF